MLLSWAILRSNMSNLRTSPHKKQTHYYKHGPQGDAGDPASVCLELGLQGKKHIQIHCWVTEHSSYSPTQSWCSLIDLDFHLRPLIGPYSDSNQEPRKESSRELANLHILKLTTFVRKVVRHRGFPCKGGETKNKHHLANLFTSLGTALL